MNDYQWSQGWLTTRSSRATNPGFRWGAPAKREAMQRIGDREWPSVRPLDRPDELAAALTPPASHAPGHPMAHARVRDWIVDPLWTGDQPDDRVWQLEIVVDAGGGMPVWDDTVADFVAALRRRQAFRTIDVSELDTDGPVLALTRPLDRRIAPDDPPGDRRSPRMVLVLTDGLGTAWSAGTALPLLQHWGQDSVVAIVHLLPSDLWGITGINPQLARLRVRSANGPSAATDWDGPGPAIPVLELGGRWLRTWTRLLARSPEWGHLQVVPSSHKWAMAATAAAPTAAQQVSDFRSSASAEAFTLATLLAAAPLNLPLIRVIQGTWLPLSRPFHLTEILAAGLLRPVAGRAEVFAPDRITYDFAPGVRRELLGFSRRASTARVVRATTQCLGYYVDHVRQFDAALSNPEMEAPAAVGNSDYNEIFRAVFEALSGPYGAHAERLWPATTAD